MHTRFTSTTNELHSLGKNIRPTKQVRKVLNIVPKSWEIKVNAITEAIDLKTLTMNDLIGNLKTYEMKKQKEQLRRKPRKKGLWLSKLLKVK